MLTGHPVEYIHNNEKLIKQTDFSKMPELCIVKMVYHDKDLTV